jgi:hypothetical protein
MNILQYQQKLINCLKIVLVLIVINSHQLLASQHEPKAELSKLKLVIPNKNDTLFSNPRTDQNNQKKEEEEEKEKRLLSQQIFRGKRHFNTTARGVVEINEKLSVGNVERRSTNEVKTVRFAVLLPSESQTNGDNRILRSVHDKKNISEYIFFLKAIIIRIFF